MNLYLSKVLIERARPLQPYEWHQLLWTLFPAPAGTPRPYLFRVEAQEEDATQILLQSNREPQAGAAVDRAQVRVLATRPLQPPQEPGQRMQFSVTVNPSLQRRVHKAEPPGAGPTRRHLVRIAHYQEEAQHAWLESRLAGAAQLEDVLIHDQRTLRFRTAKQQVGTVHTVRFTGALTVRDPEQLTRLLAKGVGPAKMLGCGMLSLAPG